MSDFYLAAELQRVHFFRLMYSHFYNLRVKGDLPSSIFTHEISDFCQNQFCIFRSHFQIIGICR